MTEHHASTKVPHPSKHFATRSRSTSLGQLPRAFDYNEEFLAKSAADAYKANPAYIAIEQDTLSAVAPFLDLRKRDRAESSTTDTSLGSSPVKTQSYAHGHRSSNSIDLSSSLLHSHNRDSSVSSVSYEDFRNSMQIVPEADFANTQDNHTTHSVSKSPFRKLSFSYGRSIPGFTPYLNNSHTSPVPIRSSSGPTAFITQYPQMAANDYGIESVGSQHIEVLQNRLRSMSLGAQRSRKSSISSLVASGSTQTATGLPDAAFTLTRFLHDCVRQHSPSSLEIDEKLRLRKEFETILQTIQPTAQLVMFGSVENGLNLANADLDLMVVDTSPVEDQLHDLHSDLPSLYAEALRGQGYCVKLLAKTRIALIKIQREYLGGVFACDICFDNPLALHNTRLLATYAACDSRVPILMMFVKLWARSRKINDSFGGTLKSYGYLLLLIYYLQNKCVPALLPNLQMVASSGRFVKPEELTCLGYDVWYSKDAEIVPTIQQNTTSVGELLEGFFSHFAYEFDYRDWVVSIRIPGGLQNKSAKGWTQLVEHMNENGSAKVKDRFILSIEDPFETTHNVARTVTRAGLYDIRGEFMAAVRAIRSNKLSELTAPNV